MSNVTCNCAETILEDSRGVKTHVKPPKWHNCQYIAERNKNIHQACVLADAQEPDRGKARWAALYSAAMEDLSKELK